MWFAEKTGNKIGRITMQGQITEFPVPTPNAGPDAMHAAGRTATSGSPKPR